MKAQAIIFDIDGTLLVLGIEDRVYKGTPVPLDFIAFITAAGPVYGESGDSSQKTGVRSQNKNVLQQPRASPFG